MKIEKKQEELDTIKWYKSVALGFDACGSFDYCSKCNKANNNPCASAYSEFFNEQFDVEAKNVIEEPQKKKTTPKKTTTKATTTKKTETTKKTTKTTTSQTSVFLMFHV